MNVKKFKQEKSIKYKFQMADISSEHVSTRHTVWYTLIGLNLNVK